MSEKENLYQNVKLLKKRLSKEEADGFSALFATIRHIRKSIDAALNTQIAKEDEEREKLEQELRQAAREADVKVAQVPPRPAKQVLQTEGKKDAPSADALTQPAGTDKPKKDKDKQQQQQPQEAPVQKPSETAKPAGTGGFGGGGGATTPSFIKGIITPTFAPPPRGKGGKPQPGAASSAPTRSKTFDPNTRPGSRPGAGTPGGVRPPRPDSGGGRPNLNVPPPPGAPSRGGLGAKKKDGSPRHDEKKGMTKRTLIRKGFLPDELDESRTGIRKLKNRKAKFTKAFAPINIEKALITTENLTVKLLSEKIGKTAQEIIKQLMVLGKMASINDVVDFETMELIAGELGVGLELRLDKTKEEQLFDFHTADSEDDALMVKRPPIITVMGHVDHGKTSLLDAIRKTNVIAGEAGGITQHIGAYSVTAKGETITFLDTPGHEAFTEMRARGAKVTDIAILVVAADDGVMPQTVEAVNHAKSAGVPIIVAINKIDKPGANIDKIKQMLTEHGLVAEEWGGDVMMAPISAKQGTGIDGLLEKILLLAEVNDYKANPKRKAKGTVIEAKVDKGMGPVATIIVQNGTLSRGDTVVSGRVYGRIRAMHDDKGKAVKVAGPSMAVQVHGLNGVPNAGDTIHVVADEKLAKQVADERSDKMRSDLAAPGSKVTLDDMFSRMTESALKTFNVIVKTDVQGTAEALRSSLLKLTNEEVKLNVVHSGVGAINKSDMMLAEVSHATVIGFNVRPDAESKQIADSNKIDVRLHNIIFEVIDDITAAMKGLIEPKYRDVAIGKAEVRNVFKITGSGIIAGSYVTDGKAARGCKVSVIRDGKNVHDGAVTTLKRFKDDVKEVASGYECGISVDGGFAVLEGDILEFFIQERTN